MVNGFYVKHFSSNHFIMINNSNVIGILKYGSCNVSSLVNALTMTSIKFEVSENVDDLKKYNKIILPGVGNMKVLSELRIKDLSSSLLDYLSKGGILYGICLGLQMLFDYSEESKINTFGIIKGKTSSLDKLIKKNLNVNFNKLVFDDKHLENKVLNKLMQGLSKESKFYYLHSYFCETKDQDTIVINSEINTIKIPSLILKNNNIIGSQFHPELSKNDGLRFIKNFTEL